MFSSHREGLSIQRLLIEKQSLLLEFGGSLLASPKELSRLDAVLYRVSGGLVQICRVSHLPSWYLFGFKSLLSMSGCGAKIERNEEESWGVAAAIKRG